MREKTLVLPNRGDAPDSLPYSGQVGGIFSFDTLWIDDKDGTIIIMFF